MLPLRPPLHARSGLFLRLTLALPNTNVQPLGNASAPCHIATRLGKLDSVHPERHDKIHLGQFTDNSDGTPSINLGSPGCRAVYQRLLVSQRRAAGL